MSDPLPDVGDIICLTRIRSKLVKDLTVGEHYRVVGIDDQGYPWVFDDAGDRNSQIACGVTEFYIVGTTH